MPERLDAPAHRELDDGSLISCEIVDDRGSSLATIAKFAGRFTFVTGNYELTNVRVDVHAGTGAVTGIKLSVRGGGETR